MPLREIAAAASDRVVLVIADSAQWTVSPVAVVVLLIRSTIIRWLVSGRPRQFMVICENSRCSILFLCWCRG